eukprot:CFRG7265T1
MSVKIKFCQECNNMLYPREDVSTRRLMYHCRNCPYKELAESPCVYSNKIAHGMDELAQIITDVATDPTLPRTRDVCSACGQTGPVHFQAQYRRSEMGMRLYYVCRNLDCGHRWCVVEH